MAWVMRSYSCQCGHDYEDLRDKEENQDTECPKCSWINKPCVSAPSIARFSLMSKSEQNASLRKRSEEHSKKMNS